MSDMVRSVPGQGIITRAAKLVDSDDTTTKSAINIVARTHRLLEEIKQQDKSVDENTVNLEPPIVTAAQIKEEMRKDDREMVD